MREVVIASAVRTAIGTFGGTLSLVPAAELGAVVIKGALERAGISGEDVDEVIMGCVLQAGQGMNVSRQASIQAGLPASVPAWTVNKVCGSGLKAVTLAAQSIMVGDADIVVAGGTESMNRAPYVLDKARTGYRMGHDKIYDSMITDGLWCSLVDAHMGITAENIAERYEITRKEQDQFALASQQKAEAAIKEGLFADEIVPVMVKQRKGEPLKFDTDEHPRFGTTMEKLAKLRPAFKRDGTVTAGNASGINDGAAAVVVMSREKAEALGVKPLAKLVGYHWAAVEPEVMGLGPVPATRGVLEKIGLTIDDIDLIEANEAFAVQSLAVMKDLSLNPERVNVNGGAIALGHPIGASGTRILVTLLYAMKKRKADLGLATLCIGGGMGIACIVRNEQ